MGLTKIAKIVSFLVLAGLITGCLEKTESLTTDNPKAATANIWQWDDVQKSWLYNGAPIAVKPSETPTSIWTQKDNAILFRVESPRALTMFDNAPKALQMKIFQLSDSKAFLQAAKSSSGLKHLLVTEQIDPAIVGMERLIVLPGVSQSIISNRQAGARYIGIVLGYSTLKQEQIFRLIPIVTQEDGNPSEKPAEESSLLTSLINRKNKQPEFKPLAKPSHPATLKINLFLEANGISKLDVDVR